MLSGGTSAIWILFDILIGEHRLECPTSMIQVQDILDQEPVGVKGGHEEFIDPLTYTLAHAHWLVWGRSGMAGHNHSNVR
jgi:hypothetical protein